MRQVLRAACLGAVVAVSSVSTAQAQEAIRPTWSGFYTGVGAGVGFNSTSTKFVAAGTSFDTSGGASAVAGGQFGYNIQLGRFVLGAEAAFVWGHPDGSTQCPATVPGSTQCSGRVSNVAFVTGRAGYAFDGQGNLLAYVKGGLANADLGTSSSGGSFDFDDRRNGWALGGGAEWKIAPHLSLGVEYMHADFGNVKFNTTPYGAMTTHPTYDSVMARLNFIFGGRETPPLK